MRLEPNADGYPSVRLTINGKRSRLAVHRLVAREYLSPRPSPAHEVRHLDGDKTNNSVENLAWGTTKENAEDRERHGRTSRGQKHSIAIKKGLEAANVAAD
ncbi:HNH endonuclease signature motif containing protein [Aurantiacibacter spongiae]